MVAAHCKDWIDAQDGCASRIEAFFNGAAFAPHRHDTYAIGVTLAGVQQFDYRGAVCNAFPGDVVVLYPDEIHDGRAGTSAGFRYKTIYIEPSSIQEICGGRPLPFLEGAVSKDPRLQAAVLTILDANADIADPFCYGDALYDLVIALNAACGTSDVARSGDFNAAERARGYIRNNLDGDITLDKLAEISGRDRWSLSRDFRLYYGVSPYRYLIMRRLDLAKKRLSAGEPIAHAAVAVGFADQSHFTRQFRNAYGVTPKRWLTASRAVAH